jgi:hypothetical protein
MHAVSIVVLLVQVRIVRVFALMHESLSFGEETRSFLFRADAGLSNKVGKAASRIYFVLVIFHVLIVACSVQQLIVNLIPNFAYVL